MMMMMMMMMMMVNVTMKKSKFILCPSLLVEIVCIKVPIIQSTECTLVDGTALLLSSLLLADNSFASYYSYHTDFSSLSLYHDY